MAAKPKLPPAESGIRTKCFDGPASAGTKDPRKTNAQLSRLVTCRNVTMDQFATLMEMFSWGTFADPITNATNLPGTWDVTLSFSPWTMIEGNGPPGSFANGVHVGGFPMRGQLSGAGANNDEPAAPSGALSIFDALEKQVGLELEPIKSKVHVMVIDHEPKPTEN